MTTPAGRPISSLRRAPATLALAAVGAVLLAACAAPRGGAEDPCNPVVGAVLGGAIGAVVGGDRQRARGVAIGAGLGALVCVAVNYQSRQTRSAEQVSEDHRRRTGGEPPAAPLVAAYNVEAVRASARPGEDVTLTSTIEVVPGRSEALRELREDFVIVDPRGVERSRLSKTPAPAGSRGGTFVSTLQFTFPQGVPPGAYQVQSRLFVNGRPAHGSSVRIQVARGEGSALAYRAGAARGVTSN